MEEEKAVVCPSSSSSSAASSRWNPTKEQIGILEGLYRQGIRTPTAEQIQQITGKLREFGAIEGKNVFYWFQNHKARQRQKQKQESFAYFSRLLHRHPPPPPLSAPALPCNRLVCAPLCLQVPQVGLNDQRYPNHFLAGGALNTPLADLQKTEITAPEKTQQVFETLKLFPLHPTGVLEEKCFGSSLTSSSSETEFSEEGGNEEVKESFPFFNFFGV